jgi:phosphate uptake regulator
MQREPDKIPQAFRLLTVIRSLERIADHSTNIAENVLFYVRGTNVRRRVDPPTDEWPVAEGKTPKLGGPSI